MHGLVRIVILNCWWDSCRDASWAQDDPRPQPTRHPAPSCTVCKHAFQGLAAAELWVNGSLGVQPPQRLRIRPATAYSAPRTRLQVVCRQGFQIFVLQSCCLLTALAEQPIAADSHPPPQLVRHPAAACKQRAHKFTQGLAAAELWVADRVGVQPTPTAENHTLPPVDEAPSILLQMDMDTSGSRRCVIGRGLVKWLCQILAMA